MIGKKIRDTRNKKKWTLTELAKSTGLTSSYLSQVEREIVEPSIASLRKISVSLEIPLYAFLDDSDAFTSVIRADQRRKLILPQSSVIYEFLSPTGSSDTDSAKLEIIFFELNAKSWSREDDSRHQQAEECIILLSGRLLVKCEDQTHELFEGDSIYIRRNIAHRVYNPGDTAAKAMMCITPPVY